MPPYLTMTLQLCSCTDAPMKLQDDISISKQNAFRMLIWLCAYYKFFCNKKVNGDILLLWLAGTSHILKKLTPEIITATINLATEWIPKQSVTQLLRDNLKCTLHT